MRTRAYAHALSVVLVLAALVAGIGLQNLHAYYVYATWPAAKVPVQYYLNPVNADMSDADAETVVRASASDWSLQSNANVSLYYMGRTSAASLTYDGKNIVFFRPDSNGSMTAQTYMWLQNGVMYEADMVVYDGGYTFLPDYSACSGSQRYLHDTTIHEFGHVLGLGHSDVAEATMWPSVSACSTSLRSLAADDIAGIEFLYPPSAAAVSAPASPSGLMASATSSSSIALTWTDSSTSEDGFYVERSTNGSAFASVAQVSANTTSFSDSSLISGTAYAYRVRAFNSGGTSGYSNTATATTPADTPTTAPPSFALSSAGRKVKGVRYADLGWSGATSAGVDVYRNDTLTSSTANTGAYTDRIGGKGGGTYQYRVCEAGTSACSNVSTVTF